MDVNILPLTRCGTLCENVNSPPLYYNLYILVLIINIIKALSCSKYVVSGASTQNMVHLASHPRSPQPQSSLLFRRYFLLLFVWIDIDPMLVLRISSPGSSWSLSVTTEDLSRRIESAIISSTASSRLLLLLSLFSKENRSPQKLAKVFMRSESQSPFSMLRISAIGLQSMK